MKKIHALEGGMFVKRSRSKTYSDEQKILDIIYSVDCTCEVCRRKFQPDELEIHHKNHNQGDNRRNNLMVLCKTCHEKIHAVEGGTFVKQSEIKAYAEMLKILSDIYSAQHNDALAKSFYRRARIVYEKIRNDLDAKFELANLYLRWEKNFSAAQKNFREYLSQAQNGGAKEMIRVGLIYAGGFGVAKDLSAAKKF